LIFFSKDCSKLANIRKEQFCYVKRLNIFDSTAKCFNILATSLNVLYNYFDSSTKLFSVLCPAKFLDTSAKLFFPCMHKKNDFAEVSKNLAGCRSEDS